MNKRDVRSADFSDEEYAEYGSLARCLAAIVKTYTRLRKNMGAGDAFHRPLEVDFVLQENGARVLFRLMGRNPLERRAAVDAWVALMEHST